MQLGGNRMELVHLTSSLDKIRVRLVLKRSHGWLHMLYSAKICWKLLTNICKAVTYWQLKKFKGFHNSCLVSDCKDEPALSLKSEANAQYTIKVLFH